MILKDFFVKRGEQGKFSKNEAFVKFLETIKEGDVPDEIDKLIEENFMTIERAKSDKKIIAAARAEAYDIIDERLEAILPFIEKIDKTLVVELTGETDTLKKISKLGPVLDKIAEKAKSAGTEETEKVKELETQKKDLLDRLTKSEETSKSNTEKLTKDFADKERNILKDFTLKSRIQKIEFADEFKDKRESIEKLILAELAAESIYLNESGQPEIGIIENGVPKPKFLEGTNTQLTFDKVLEDKVKPFVKRNNADTKDKKDQPRHRQQQAQPEGKMTLKEMQRAANPPIARA